MRAVVPIQAGPPHSGQLRCPLALSLLTPKQTAHPCAQLCQSRLDPHTVAQLRCPLALALQLAACQAHLALAQADFLGAQVPLQLVQTLVG